MADTDTTPEIEDGDYYIINARSAREAFKSSNAATKTSFSWDIQNVWQYYNATEDDYIYTTNYDEYTHIVNTWPGFRGDGVAFQLNPNDKAIPVYELGRYNTYNWDSYGNKYMYKQHLYTIQTDEVDTLTKDGWTNLGIIFYGNSNDVGSVPVYREWVGRNRGVHWLGVTPDTSNGWVNEGVCFYSGGLLALAAAGNVNSDYTNVEINFFNYSNAQVWSVKTRDDGSKRIMNRTSGKNLDVIGGWWNSGVADKYAQGQNVGLFHDYISDTDGKPPENQAWTFSGLKASLTLETMGFNYSGALYTIGLDPNADEHNKNWYLELWGQDGEEHVRPGVNVDIAYNENITQQTEIPYDSAWIFIPVNRFNAPSSIVSIRPLYSPDMRLDCSGPPYNNGTNVYIHGYSGSGNQDWAIVVSPKDPSKYVVRNLGGSNMYLDVYGREENIYSGSNVNIYSYDGYTMDWTIDTYGTYFVDGVECPIVSFSVTGSDGKKYMLDVDGARNIDNNNVWAVLDNGTQAQRWVLYPELGRYANDIPVPSDIGFTNSLAVWHSPITALPYVDGVKNPNQKLPNLNYYVEWKCTDAWLAGDNVYEWRWRTRYFVTKTQVYSAWSSWTSWTVPSVTIPVNRSSSDNGYIVVSDPINVAYYTTDYLDKQYEFNVRCVGTAADNTSMIRGGVGERVCDVAVMPKYDFDQAGMSFDGLHLGFTMDYPLAGNIFITSVQKNGKNLLLNPSKSIDKTGIKNSYSYPNNAHSVVIPLERLSEPVKNGDNLTVSYYVGSAVNFANSFWMTSYLVSDRVVPVKMEAGTIDAKPVAYACYRHLGIVTLPKYSTCRLWYYYDGQSTELNEYNGTEVEIPADKKAFFLPYRFGEKKINLVSSVSDESGDKWGTYYGPIDPGAFDMSPVHAWYYEGLSDAVCIDCRQGDYLESNLSLEADYNKLVLNDREHEMVTFNKTIKNNFSIQGAIMHSDEFGYTDCSTKEIEALVRQHMYYRNPKGDFMYVAITKVTVTGHHHWDEVQVDMTQEDDFN